MSRTQLRLAKEASLHPPEAAPTEVEPPPLERSGSRGGRGRGRGRGRGGRGRGGRAAGAESHEEASMDLPRDTSIVSCPEGEPGESETSTATEPPSSHAPPPPPPSQRARRGERATRKDGSEQVAPHPTEPPPAPPVEPEPEAVQPQQAKPAPIRGVRGTRGNKPAATEEEAVESVTALRKTRSMDQKSLMPSLTPQSSIDEALPKAASEGVTKTTRRSAGKGSKATSSEEPLPSAPEPVPTAEVETGPPQPLPPPAASQDKESEADLSQHVGEGEELAQPKSLQRIGSGRGRGRGRGRGGRGGRGRGKGGSVQTAVEEEHGEAWITEEEPPPVEQPPIIPEKPSEEAPASSIEPMAAPEAKAKPEKDEKSMKEEEEPQQRGKGKGRGRAPKKWKGKEEPAGAEDDGHGVVEEATTGTGLEEGGEKLAAKRTEDHAIAPEAEPSVEHPVTEQHGEKEMKEKESALKVAEPEPAPVLPPATADEGKRTRKSGKKIEAPPLPPPPPPPPPSEPVIHVPPAPEPEAAMEEKKTKKKPTKGSAKAEGDAPASTEPATAPSTEDQSSLAEAATEPPVPAKVEAPASQEKGKKKKGAKRDSVAHEAVEPPSSIVAEEDQKVGGSGKDGDADKSSPKGSKTPSSKGLGETKKELSVPAPDDASKAKAGAGGDEKKDKGTKEEVEAPRRDKTPKKEGGRQRKDSPPPRSLIVPGLISKAKAGNEGEQEKEKDKDKAGTQGEAETAKGEKTPKKDGGRQKKESPPPRSAIVSDLPICPKISTPELPELPVLESTPFSTYGRKRGRDDDDDRMSKMKRMDDMKAGGGSSYTGRGQVIPGGKPGSGPIPPVRPGGPFKKERGDDGLGGESFRRRVDGGGLPPPPRKDSRWNRTDDQAPSMMNGPFAGMRAPSPPTSSRLSDGGTGTGTLAISNQETRPAKSSMEPPPTRPPDFVIERHGKGRQEELAAQKKKLQDFIKNNAILQHSKVRDKLTSSAQINKEGSFIREYITDYNVYAEDGITPLPEPRVAYIQDDFTPDFKGEREHPPNWWGVKLTKNDGHNFR